MTTQLATTEIQSVTPTPVDVAAQRRNARCLVTDRDRQLLALLSTTRYLTTAQANALVRPGRDESVGRRRLFSLAGLAPRRRGSGNTRSVFDHPFVRRLQFRRTHGERVDLWAVTRIGEALAAEVLGREPRIERNDVSELFREHWVVLTDLFVALAAPLLARGISVRELPFRWDPTETTELPWHEYDRASGRTHARMMVPDAILELPALKRRLLIECEMGSHSIVSQSDEKCGATLKKIERYDEFFGAFPIDSAEATFYQKAFPDSWPAEVLVLVRTKARRTSVNAAISRWRSSRAGATVSARAVTLSDAVAEVGKRIGSIVPELKPHLSLGHDDIELLRRFYQEAIVQLGAAGRPLPDAFRQLALGARTVLVREDVSRESPRKSSALIATSSR